MTVAIAGDTTLSAEPTANDKPTTSTAAPSDDVATLRARLDKLEKDNASLRDESASRRIKAKEEADKALKLAEEKGEFDKVIAAHRARIAELEPLESDAKAWRSFAEQERARLDAKRDGLPAHWQSVYDAAGSIEAKRAVLAAIEADTGKTSTPKAAPPSGGAPAAGAPDWSQIAASGDRDAIRAAREADPTGWRALTSRNSAPRPISTTERMAQARKAQPAAR